MKYKEKQVNVTTKLLLLILTISFVFSIFNIVALGLIKENKKTVHNTLENKYYVIGKDPTAYQKENFKELSEAIKDSVDQKEIANLVAKAFVADFFTWRNKDASYEIGGLQYFYDPVSFKNSAQWNYYQKLDVFINTYGKNNLPEVVSVNVLNSVKDIYTIDETDFASYNISLNFVYDQNTSLNRSELVDSLDLVLIDDNGKLLIVDVLMVSEEEDEQ